MPLRTVIFILWGLFWLYWLVAAAGAKQGIRAAGFACRGCWRSWR